VAKIVIIGAGLTGISTAYHLEQRGFYDYELYEKEAVVGGLCRSVTQDGFTFDFTGHLLHTSDEYFKQLLDTLVGLDQFNTINRRSYIHSHDVYTKYPFQINLYGLPPSVIADCIEGYVAKEKLKLQPHNFYNWVLTTFGKGIAEHFFFGYQRKIFDYNLRKISPTWMGRFVPTTSLRQMVIGATQPEPDATIGYNANFFYPQRGGIQSWVTTFAQHITNPIHTNHTVQNIDFKEKRIVFTNGHTTTYEHLISTMPLDLLLDMADESSVTTLKRARSKLLCNSVVNFNLGFNRADVSDKHWIYFPETKFPFYRVGFYHNFSEHMAPPGCSSLYGEFAYVKTSQAKIKQRLADSLRSIKEVLRVSDEEIITQKVMTIDHAYVIYDFWREKHLPALHKTLNGYDVHSIGRYGAWKYSSMQEAVLEGKQIAQQLTVLPARAERDIVHSHVPHERTNKELVS
jgi:protoporphyrinogen oxidase